MHVFPNDPNARCRCQHRRAAIPGKETRHDPARTRPASAAAARTAGRRSARPDRAAGFFATLDGRAAEDRRGGCPAGGLDVYTEDSPLAVAAVHAGVVRPGERAVVRVSVLPGRDHYEGSTRNGVTTQNYGKWDGSYRVEPLPPPVVAHTPNALEEF